LTLAGLAATPPQAAAADERPNVLFLFADDQRADTIAALGNSQLQTPTLDQLARRGFAFRNAYCLGANQPAVCTPSRNMLLSGRSYFRWQGALAPATASTFPAVMKAAGYETYHHGKRGNTALKIQEQFETNKYLKNDEAERRSGEPGQEIADPAIKFLLSRERDRPFFMYLAFGNPHDPRVAAEKYRQKYDAAKIPLPKNFLPLHPFNNGELLVRDERLAAWPRTEQEIRGHLHDYYATITGLDHHLGRIIEALKDSGQYENTLIIFSADHGLAVGSHGLLGKQNLYEHSMKAPLIFAGPGIAPGKSDALAYLLDIFPTVCDLVGAPVPKELDGESLAPMIHDPARPGRKSLFLAYRDLQRAVRDERWKLIRYPQIDKTQLFDLASDPEELQDRSHEPEQAARIESLLAELESWQKRLGDKAPLTAEKIQSAAWTPPAN
jgi:arylsulfatase A-like enzyme